MQQTRTLIVTADDFNLSDGVSRGILEAHQRGIVTETSVMVNMGDLCRASDLLGEAPQLGVGLHLNLTRGQPLAPQTVVGAILGNDGLFRGSPRALPSPVPLASVRAEFQAQLDAFVRAFGGLPGHLDTHHHIHQDPAVLEALLDLAAPLRLPVRGLDPTMRASIRARGLWTPEHFLGDVAEGPYWTASHLVATLRALQPGQTELMCHPGYFDAAIAYSSYGPQRDGEREALCDPTVAAVVGEMDVQLVSYAAAGKGI